MTQKPSITVPISEIRAMLHFVCKDHTRYILHRIHCETDGKTLLLVATNGASLGVIKSRGMSFPESTAFELPLPDIPLRLMLKLASGKDDTATFTLDREAGTLGFVSSKSRLSITVPLQKHEYDTAFPKWRQVIPAPPAKTDSGLAISSIYLGDFISASKALVARGKRPTLRFAAADDLSPIVIRIDGVENFFGVVMPVRVGHMDTIPPWLPKEKATHAPEAAPAPVAQ